MADPCMSRWWLWAILSLPHFLKASINFPLSLLLQISHQFHKYWISCNKSLPLEIGRVMSVSLMDVCGSGGEESACQCRRCSFNLRFGKITLEKETATHSSILAWEIPWTEEPGGLQSMGLQRVEHNWVTKHTNKSCHLASCLSKPPWKRVIYH